MERKDDLIDLGAATVETQGTSGVAIDQKLGQLRSAAVAYATGLRLHSAR